MKRVIWAPHSAIALTTATDSLLRYLSPFVRCMASEMNKGASLQVAATRTGGAYPLLAPYFSLDCATLEESFGLRDCHLFPESDPVRSVWCENRQRRTQVSLPAGYDLLPAVHDLIALCASAAHTIDEIRDRLENPAMLDLLLDGGLLDTGPSTSTNVCPPGVYRLQHASLLYRTANAGILLDPHFHSFYEPGDLGATIARWHMEGLVDAILISHSHGDHYNLGSLVTFPRDVPIIVPHVPRGSILCPDMRRQLLELGFTNVMSPHWYSPGIRIRDIEVHVLPFYGEQPLSTERTRDPDLRNWGNTYVLTTSGTVSWALIDSGEEAIGRMQDVARYVKERFGPVDLLFSNLRRFHVGALSGSPFYITEDGSYWLSLSADQVRRFPQIKDCLTLGPNGVAEICKAVDARFFLPYAHWWNEIDSAPSPEESDLLAELHDGLRKLGAKTAVIPWRTGQGFPMAYVKASQLRARTAPVKLLHLVACRARGGV